MGKRLKRIASLVLSLAMAVTLLPTQYAYAAGGTDSQPAVVSDNDGEEVPEPILQFTFDDDYATDAMGIAKATGSGTTQIVADNERGNVLSLSNSGFLTVTNKNDAKSPLVGKKALTISYWSKDSASNNRAGWAYFIRKSPGVNDYSKDQGYTAVIDGGGSVTAERFWGGNNEGRENGSIATSGFAVGEWKQVTVVLDEESTSIYVNGEFKTKQEGQDGTGDAAKSHRLEDYLGADSIFQIGKGNWESGQYFTGKIDDFKVYNGALTAEQVGAAYEKDKLVSLTVNFKCGDEVLSTITQEKRNASASYTYIPEDKDVTYSVGDKVYVRETEQTGLTVTNPADAINVAYQEAKVESIPETYVTTRVGVAPKLPDKVNAKFEGNVTAPVPVEWEAVEPEAYAQVTTEPKTIKGTAGGKEATLKLTVKKMDDYLIADYDFDMVSADDGKAALDNWTDKTKTDGSVKAEADGDDKAKVTITDGLIGQALSLPGGGSGGKAHVKLPDGLLKKDNATVGDFTISLFVKGDEGGWQWPATILASGNQAYFAVQNKEGNGFQAEYRNGKNDSDKKSAEGNRIPALKKTWRHLAVVVSSTTHTITVYEGGSKQGTVTDAAINIPALAGKNNAWNSLGKSPYPADTDFQGMIDEFKIYDAELTEAEIKGICERGFGTQVTKAKNDLAITFAEGDSKDSVTQNFTLPTKGSGIQTGVTWTSDSEYVSIGADGEAAVSQPSKKVGDKDVTLTAHIAVTGSTVTDDREFTVKVKAKNTLSYDLLNNTIAEAEAKVSKWQAAKIYKESSITALNAAISTAKEAVKEEEEPYDAAKQNAIDDAQSALAAEAAKEPELKTVEELKTVLEAYYPLTGSDVTKDESGKNRDAAKVGTGITGSEADGATFPGSTGTGDAKRNHIKLPVDKIDVADNMTFSFWVKAVHTSGDRRVFSISSGKAPATDQHHFSVLMGAKGGRIDAVGGSKGWTQATGSAGITAAENTWHQITCVLGGDNSKSLAVYVDGVKESSDGAEVGVSLSEVWAAHSTERDIWLGNNGYYHNGNGAHDPDFEGNIKYLRIYGATLAETQVQAIYNSEKESQAEYAVTALMDEIGASKSDGTYTKTISGSGTSAAFMPTGKGPALPTSGAQGAAVTWTQTLEDGTACSDINVATGSVALPASGDRKVKLKAAVAVLGAEKEAEILCTLKKISNEEQVAKQELEGKITALKTFKQTETVKQNTYTPDSWTALGNLITEAESLKNNAEATKEMFEAMTGRITNAMNKEHADYILKDRADFTALTNKIAEAERKLDPDKKSEYEDAVWDEFATAVATAKAVEADKNKTQAEVNAAVTALETAMGSFVPKPKTKTELTSYAGTLKTELDAIKQNGTYSPEKIAELETLLAQVESTTDANADALYKQLEEAMNALKATQGTVTPPATVEVTGVTLSDSALSLVEQKTGTLTAIIAPVDATNRNVTWTSSDSKKVKVEQDAENPLKATITAVAAGTADITVTTEDGNKTATCKVTVTKKAVKPPVVKVKKITITESIGNGKKPAVAAGKKITLKASVSPANASNKAVTWSLSKKDGKYASISKKGVLTAKAKGAGKTVTVTATAKDAGKKKVSIKIKIMKDAVTKITLKAGKNKVKAGKKITIKAVVAGKKKNAKISKALAFSIDKKSAKYASINSKGVLSTKKAAKGKTITVTAKATDGSKKTKKIKIKVTK